MVDFHAPLPPLHSTPSTRVLKADEYIAQDTYKATGTEELGLVAREVVMVLEKTDGWWFCVKEDSSEGWYVQLEENRGKGNKCEGRVLHMDVTCKSSPPCHATFSNLFPRAPSDYLGKA
jgi:hypothetical protein